MATDYILDIGCGDYPKPNATHLCDLYPTSNRERPGPLKTDNKPFVNCTIEFLPFQDDAFSFAYACHILEHANNPKVALSETTRVALKGYIETPTDLAERVYGWSVHKWIFSFKGGRLFCKPRKKFHKKVSLHRLYSENRSVRLIDGVLDCLLGWRFLRIMWQRNGGRLTFEKITFRNRHRYEHLMRGIELTRTS